MKLIREVILNVTYHGQNPLELKMIMLFINVFKSALAKLPNPAGFVHEHVGFVERPKLVGSTHSKCLGYLRTETSYPNHHCRRHNMWYVNASTFVGVETYVGLLFN